MGYNVIGMRKYKSFTLIEILITIGVMAVISAGVMSAIGPGPKRTARDTQRKADLAQIVSALEIFRSDNPGYPTTLTVAPMPNYLPAVPADPTAGRNYSYVPGTCAGGYCRTYVLCASLEKDYATLPAIAACTVSCGTTCNYSVAGP